MEMRRLAPEDAPAVARLAAQLGYPIAAEEARRRLEALEASPADAAIGAVVEGRLLGWIHVQARLTLETGAFAEIAAVVVDEAARSAGIGRALVAAAEVWAAARGLSAMHVRSNVVRERTHRFYAAIGYERVKTSHVLVRPLAARVRGDRDRPAPGAASRGSPRSPS